MPYSTFVPQGDLERPQRTALQRTLEAMTPPGLVQQGTMLRERFDALGPVRVAERTADDLTGLFGRLGPISPLEALSPARLGARAGAAAGRAAAESEAGVEAELRAGETLREFGESPSGQYLQAPLAPARSTFGAMGEAYQRGQEAAPGLLGAGLGALGAVPAGFGQLGEQAALGAGFTPEQARFQGRLAGIVSPGVGGLEQGGRRLGQLATAGLGTVGAAKGALETPGGPQARLGGAVEGGLNWAQFGQPVGAVGDVVRGGINRLGGRVGRAARDEYGEAARIVPPGARGPTPDEGVRAWDARPMGPPKSAQDSYNTAREGGYRRGQTWVYDAEEDGFRLLKQGETLVDRRDGGTVPYVAVQRRGDGTAYIGDLFVPEGQRGQGLGARMYRHLADWAERTGSTLISGSDRTPLAQSSLRGAYERGLVDVVARGEVDEVRPRRAPGAGPGLVPSSTAEGDDVLGIRRGQRMRMPPLTPEQQVQRAADGAAEQRVFDAIRALWRRGPAGEEIADELRFLSVGKGEAGEAAARELLASRGLEDVLPPPEAAGVLPPSSPTAGEGALGLARRATEPLGAAAARTPGERAFDVASGTAGGVVGAATAPEDATWQERVGRGALGASLGALGGANLRQLGRVARGALGDEALGVVPRTAVAESDLARAAREAREARLGVPPEQAGPPLEAAQGVSGWGRAADIATSAPLLRPSSLLTNLLGGAARTFQRWSEESAGALLTEGAVQESLADLLGMASEVPGALRALPRTFRQGGTSAVRGQLGAQSGSLVTDPGLGAQLLTAGTRLNLAPDAAWGRINAAGAKARAAARGITDPDDVGELSGRAMDFAQWAGKASKLTEFLGGFRETLTDPNASGAQKAWALGMVGVTPYLRMPERFLAATGRLLGDLPGLPLSALRRSENGLVRQALQGNQEAKREVVGRMAISGLAYTLGLGAYAGGQLYGAPPKDATQRRQMEAAGAQWNTLMGVDLKKLGNFGQAMSGMGTALYAAQRKYEQGADGSDVMRAFFSEAGRWALEESFLRGLSDFDVAIRQGRFAQHAEKVAADIVTRPLSGIAGYVDPFDPYERERRGTANELLEGLPGGRFALPTRVDPATGEAVRREGSWLDRMLFGSRGVVESPEGRELARLGVTAREFQPADTVYGNVQTPAARRVLQETFGRTARDYIRDTMARADYQGATPEEQAATLQRQLGVAQKLADLEVGDRVARDPQARYELEWLRTPHSQGVTGAPDAVARRNLEISEAKQLLSEYRQRYGTGAGTDRLYREDRKALDLAMTPEIPAQYLAEQQAKLRQRLGAPDTRGAALPGAGNRVLPPSATPAFTAP